MDIFRTNSGQNGVFDGINFVDISCSDNSTLTENKVISLFSGAGGLDIGLEWAGYETALCVEIDPDCRATLSHNRPSWTLFEDSISGYEKGDIRSLTTDRLFELSGLNPGEAALVAGGAPCQSFSNIGKRDGIESRKNGMLFMEFLRIVEMAQPKAALFENVVGITHAKHRSILETMESDLRELGYGVSSIILNAANYGVPQRRERFILIAIKNAACPAFPLPTHYKGRLEWLDFLKTLDSRPEFSPSKWKTLKEAFRKIPVLSKERSDYALMNCSELVQKRMEYIAQGENFHVLPMNMRPNCWKTGKHQGTDTFGRLKIDEPAVTIRTAAYNPAKGKYIHPLKNRGLSSHEMAAIQGFPYSWEFKCVGRQKVTLVSAGRQIGNAVPPPLAEAIGKAIRFQLEDAKCAPKPPRPFLANQFGKRHRRQPLECSGQS